MKAYRFLRACTQGTSRRRSLRKAGDQQFAPPSTMAMVPAFVKDDLSKQ
jgi:hypothetical protein